MTLNDWGRVLVSVIVVFRLYRRADPGPHDRRLQGNAPPDMILVMLGALAAAFRQVVSFWVGSSSSSEHEGHHDQNMADKA
jgi:hypothetical protein